VFLVDRREQNEETEDVSIYKDTAKIPKDAVAEYYSASTLEMIVPEMKVNDVDDANVDDEKENDDDGKGNDQEEQPSVAADDDDEKENDDDDDDDDGNAATDGNPIGARHHCNGSVLTLSFQVKAEDEVKLYLYWNGTTLPLKSDYLKNVLSHIFNMEFGDNQQFMDNTIDRYIKRLKDCLKI